MEAGGGWCSTAIMVPLLNEAPILATGRWHGPLKLVAFVQKLLSFTSELIPGSVGASPRSGFIRFITAGIAAGGAVAGLLLPRGSSSFPAIFVVGSRDSLAEVVMPIEFRPDSAFRPGVSKKLRGNFLTVSSTLAPCLAKGKPTL